MQAVLFDCDGVLYRSPDPAPGAKACLQDLLQSGGGRQVFFVTNNSAANPVQLRDKLTQILDLDEGVLTTKMMISTAFTAAKYLRQQYLLDANGNEHSTQGKLESSDGGNVGRRVYVIGSQGLRAELAQTGFEVLHSSDKDASMSRDDLASYDFDFLGSGGRCGSGARH